MRHPNQFRAGHGAPIWSTQEKLDLLRMHKDKITRAEIARRLGKTKNAVIGQLDRLLRQGKPVRRAKPSGTPAEWSGGKCGGNNNPSGWNGKTTRKLAAKLPQPRPPLKLKDNHRYQPQLPKPMPNTPTKSITTAERHHCRYIADMPELITADTLIFCGEQVKPETSYCPEHARLLLQPFRPRPV